MPGKPTKYQIATAAAILFHAIGMMGILFFNKAYFVHLTPENLLLMLLLLIWTQKGKNGPFVVFFFLCFVVGILLEIAGVQTGAIFGHYHYGKSMGFQWFGTPLILGVNWFLIIYCSGMTLSLISSKQAGQHKKSAPSASGSWNGLLVLEAATLAVFFDWLMEPVAVKLGYWQWDEGGGIPVFNYVCWFVASVLLLSIFQVSKFEKGNKFAVNLLLVQLIFFFALRFFLN